MTFKFYQEKGIIPFEFLLVIHDYNGVDIKQFLHYVYVFYENLLQ